ncbi:Uncharacterized protein OBRU01_12020 [Operophtera brumata]|uniref:PKD/Chitinase domain-containing protein n=1 Tax=Operophtera brumata TaxID=104452 RepID=A0A0L7LB05_OPEBR|nr:Uncharacterized protein OBRU01_12020 [Operophtera brumata]
MDNNIILGLTFILLFSLNIKLSLSQYNKAWSEKYERNLTAGNFTEKTTLKGLRQCVMSCCVTDTCNIVFIVDARCYHVECVSDELCLPLLRTGARKWVSHVSMILVKPVLPSENWSDILDQSSLREISSNYSPEEEPIYPPYTSHQNDLEDEDPSNFLTHFIDNLPVDDDDSRDFDKYRDNSDMIMDSTSFLEKISCEVGAVEMQCPFNSECIPLALKLRNGFCKCVPGTEENAQGSCVQTLRPYSKGPTIPIDAIKKDDSEVKSDSLKTETSSAKSIQTLTVSILSKQVQLPDKEVTLAAYTIPDEKATMSHYNYVWTLVDQPSGGFTGNMNQNGATVTLTDLTEGQYRFKLTVNGTNSYGEGFANVTVLPPQRINTPPLVVITPQIQTVKLPNSMAVLDGSASKPPLLDGPTLVLKDLKLPGNYTFKLTVEDSDHVKNSTTANITFISLPQTWITLNGSISHDDHRIVAYTWRCLSGPTNSNIISFNESVANATALTKGQYVFSLTVLDDNGNSATDNSSDDFRIVSWRWTRAGSGLAAGAVILGSDTQPVLMLTNIEAGRYVFELTVSDDQGETDRDTVSVQLDSLVQKMSLLLKGGTQVNVTENKVIEGINALELARTASRVEGRARVRSTRCLSACSGRGTCEHATRTCRCDAFWMQSLFTQLDPDAIPDCVTSKDLLSETETDSDVLFESKSKTTSFAARAGAGGASNGDLPHNGWKKNGHHKTGRKIKT